MNLFRFRTANSLLKVRTTSTVPLINNLDKEGLEIVTAEDGSKKMHLELSIDPHFAPKDVKVWAKGNKVYVRGKMTSETKTDKSSHTESREFYKAFVTPLIVDASKAHAEMGEGHLVVEAPLYK